MINIRKYFCLFVILVIFFSCGSDQFEKWHEAEIRFYKGDHAASVDQLRELVEDAGEKDKLLFLMEAGVILHTIGDYKKSIAAFKQADDFAERIKKSISKEVLSFLLSDKKSNFTGENFERVLIKFYLALNYIMLNDYESAKRAFRKLDYDLKYMKYEDNKYKQNLAARYLDAIISESLGRYNDARVQYKNIEKIDPKNSYLLSDRYILASKERDAGDKAKYKSGKKNIIAFDKDMKRIPYKPDMGELIIIHQAGRAPAKVSRGRILEDKEFMVALRAAIYVAIVAEGAAVSTSGVLAMMTTAENPIPIYKKRDKRGAGVIGVNINNVSAGRTRVYNNYEQTALRNYNDNYSKLIIRNVASIATKVVLASIAADKLSDKVEESSGGGFLAGKLGRFIIGAGTGKLVAETVNADLRCWRLLPSNFQITRIFLEQGEYKVSFDFPGYTPMISKFSDIVTIKKGQPAFVNFRSMSTYIEE